MVKEKIRKENGEGRKMVEEGVKKEIGNKGSRIKRN